MIQSTATSKRSHLQPRGAALGLLLIASLSACWGDVRNALTTEPELPDRHAPPGAPAPNHLFVSVTTGWHHSCALAPTGKAWCWGYNTNRGQLGNGSWDDSNVPTEVVGDLTFGSLSGGAFHTCGVTPTGKGYCWGKNEYGQLGDGSGADTSFPVPVAGNLSFRAIHAGEFSTCGLTTGGKAYCWGRNNVGQLGNGGGGIASSNVPVAVAGGLTFQTLGVGHQHACGIAAGGAAYCWGRNPLGQLGDGTRANRSQPVQVAGGLRFSQIDGSQHNSCALTTDGRAYCWGDNWHNQVGNGSGRGAFPTPQPVADVPAFVAIGTGGDHACALTSAGEAWCWGDNLRGSLGYFLRSDYNPPRPVPGGLTFSVVSGGGWDHFCTVGTDGNVFCWGLNQKGQLGDGTNHDRHAPTRIRFP
jgi:alpha-tubulin suppressor-like RCC1 family protein